MLLLTREQHVHELTVGGPAAHLLDLPQLGVEAVVDPGQHLVPAKSQQYSGVNGNNKPSGVSSVTSSSVHTQTRLQIAEIDNIVS